MAKVRFFCEGCRVEELDTIADLGLEDGEWEEMAEEERLYIVDEWANEDLEVWYEDED